MHCRYTGTSLFESTSLTVFNTLFTSLPVIFLGILEQDLNASTLLAVPELYVTGQRNQGFNIRKYVAWMFMAVTEAMIIYFCMFGLFGETIFTNNDDLLAMGTLCFSSAVIFINTKLLIIVKHNKTYLTAIAFTLSVGGWFVWQLFLSGVGLQQKKNRWLYPMKNDFIDGFGANLLWWLVLLLSVASLVLFELGVNSVRKAFWPTDTDIFQELQKDKIIKARFEETVRREEDGEGLDGVQMGREKESMEVKREEDREGDIRELLERPRIMGDVGEVVRSPVEIEDGLDGVAGRSGRGRNLKQRKFSVDQSLAQHAPQRSGSLGAPGSYDGLEEVELGTLNTNRAVPKLRHSIDVAELLGRRN
jgi:phospholipid-translocating ATPase